METTPTTRKRAGRPPKTVLQAQQTDANLPSCLHDIIGVSGPIDYDRTATVEQLKDADTSIVSSVDEVLNVESTPAGGLNIGGGSECRRSSRKKVIKFDVRDLLNKNRKPHKIQIEARIDSNAPTSSKPTVHVSANPSATATRGSANCGMKDLTSNQKTFIEKSAIFRRFSFSEQQNKGISQLRPPSLLSEASPKLPLLGKVSDGRDDADAADLAKIAQTRRLSRTQEIFNASMIKSKQNSSLIVAQMESSSGSICSNITCGNTLPAMQQKRNAAGKKKGSKVFNITSLEGRRTNTDGIATTQKKRGRPPKSKITQNTTVCSEERNIDISQSSVIEKDNTTFEAVDTPEYSNKAKPNLLKQSPSRAMSAVCKQPDSAKNWQEYKALLKETDAVETDTEGKISSDGHYDREVKNESYATLQMSHQQDIVLEISSSNSESENCDSVILSDAKTNVNTAVLVNESKQRNFAAVSFLQESAQVDNDSDNVAAPDFIVAAVEEILVDTQTLDTESKNICIDGEREYVAVELLSQSNETGDEILIKDLPARCSVSSSESETNSERGKSYRKGDKLRINLKRVSITGSPITSASSPTSSSSTRLSEILDTSTSPDDVSRCDTKARKRLTKKIVTSKQGNCSEISKQIADAITVKNIRVDQVQNEGKDLRDEGQIPIKPSQHIGTFADKADEIANAMEQENSEKLKDALFMAPEELRLNPDLISTQTNSSSESMKEIGELQTEEIKTGVADPNENVGDIESNIATSDVTLIEECTSQGKREHSRLPLKKQISKFQIYKTDFEKQSPKEAVREDPLEPCVSAKNASIQKGGTESDSHLCIPESLLFNEQSSASMTKARALIKNDSTEEENDIPDKGATSIATSEPETDTSNTFDAITNEPVFGSEITSSVSLRKVTRRYERRSRRGEAAPRTLEETFAEIAAESSKEILKLTALKNNRKEEDQEEIEPRQQELKQTETTDTEKCSPSDNNKTSGNACEQPAKQKEVHSDVLKFIVPENSKETPIGISILHKKDVGIEDKTSRTTQVPAIEQGKTFEDANTTSTSPSKEVLDLGVEEPEMLVMSQTVTTQSSFISNLIVCGSQTNSVQNSSSGYIEELPTDRSPEPLNIIEVIETVEKAAEDGPQDSDDNANTNSIPLQWMPNISMDKEDRIGDLPPKKRLSKFQAELGNLEMVISKTDSQGPTGINTCTSDKEISVLKEDCLKNITAVDDTDKDLSNIFLKNTEKTTEMEEIHKKELDIKLHAQTEENSQIPTFEMSTPKCHKEKGEDLLIEQSITTTSGKKKQKKSVEDLKTRMSKSSSKVEEIEKEKDEKIENSDSKIEDCETVEFSKKLEEKSAKKKRQKRLKEAFEAALSEDVEVLRSDLEASEIKKLQEDGSTSRNQQSQMYTPPIIAASGADKSTKETSAGNEERAATVSTQLEEEPDPLKDIEKFIEDGVNLLKRGYKIGDEDSVDDVVDSKLVSMNSSVESVSKYALEQEHSTAYTAVDSFNIETGFITSDKTENPSCQVSQIMFETPADTPVTTPTVTPPPKSPFQEESADETSLRRSHRIKQITRTPKALVGRGLVRDKERISMKDDVETKSHYSLDDHLMDLAEVEAKNAKFLKDMEERLSNFHVIKENEYKCERVVSREARKMLCDCFLTCEEEGRGELGCGEDCLNRLLMIECGPDCNVKERCTNKRFQKFLCSPCRVFRTEKKGFGIMADIEILAGEFIMEYVGEVIDGDEFERRRTTYSQEKNRHYYFMALRSDAIIDATIKGNISRFINHSCDPNAETQKWTVNGELRIGFFSRKSIMPGEEITFDYQYQRYGREAQRCYCESASCRGWIGEEPNSDEGEQLVEVDSDEENLTENLLDDDDDEDDSDESVTDAEEVQKKLEIAAAEAKLISISGIGKFKQSDERIDSMKDKRKKTGAEEEDKKYAEEDSNIKLKKLLNKMAEKVAAKKKKQKQTEHDKKHRKRNTHSSSDSSPGRSRYLEDPDIEDEVHFLSRCGLKNQSDTLRLSRLMVRAKLVQTRLDLLQILRKGEVPCRRLFLDYHGLRLLHGWMSEDGGDMHTRMALLQTLESLPIANKSVLTDSKVYQMVENWCGTTPRSAMSTGNSLSPSDESSKDSSSSNSQQVVPAIESVPTELQKLAKKLLSTWNSLPEIFRIPKRERIEQMKEHEREADRQYAAAVVEEDRNKLLNTDRYQRDRFGRSLSNRFAKPHSSKEIRNITIIGSTSETRRRIGGVDSGSAPLAVADNSKHLSKEQRRELFAAKVARDEAEKRLAEERREFETKCRFFGLDPKRTRPQDMPFFVNPATGQWYSVERQLIPTPPSYAHVQVPVKPKSTDPADYQLPAAVATLPPHWKYAITPQGKLYYYHVQSRIAQWDPPSPAQMHGTEDKSGGATQSDGESEDADTAEDSTDNDDDIIMSMDSAKLKVYIEKKIEERRQKRYIRLVDEKAISPRREEDRIYNQLEVRKYKENKEKIRKRKEEIRRRRVQALRYSTSEPKVDDGSNEAAGSEIALNSLECNGSDDEQVVGVLPIQDYLLSSDEEDIVKAECNNSPLLEKIVEGDKIVDELDALTSNRTLKRALPPHREQINPQINTSIASSSSLSTLEKQEQKKRKLEKRERSKKSKESDSKYRKLKEKFRCEIAGIIVPHLKPYRKDSCLIGRIQSDEDFNHLARKLTHFVMIKELKYCESVGQTLVVTESVKNKSREFIKKYMAKYGDVYEKPKNDPEFKDIPFTL